MACSYNLGSKYIVAPLDKALVVFLTPYNAIFLGICIKKFLMPEVGEDNPIAAEIFVT